jgi:general secretion pathway protein A
MDYLHFFGFHEDPFKLTPDPAYFFPSSGHNEGLMLMDYAIDQKEGFLLLTGDPGTGKTTLLKVFLEKWKDRAEIAMILTPRLSPGEFLCAVAEDLNISLEDRNKNEIIRALRDFLTRKSGEGRRVIIIVDEAQNLPLETLEELRLLSNLETDKDKLIQIMLIGQPELEAKLMAIKLRQLNQRITTRVHLNHFSAEETREYISYRIIKAGRKNLRVHDKAGRLTHKITHGVPRLINMLMSRALMAAYLEEKNIVSSDHVRHAVKSLGHSEMQIDKRSNLVPVAAGMLALAILTVSVYLYLPDKRSETSERAFKENVFGAPVQGASGHVLHMQKTREDAETGPGSRTGEENDAAPAAIESVQLSDQTAAETSEKDEETSAAEEALSLKVPVDAEHMAVRPEDGREAADDRNLTDADTVDSSEPEQAGDLRFISITADVAFFRQRPTTESGKAGWVTRGSQLLVLDESLDKRNVRWYQVAYQGEKKWISGEVAEAVGWIRSPQ